MVGSSGKSFSFLRNEIRPLYITGKRKNRARAREVSNFVGSEEQVSCGDHWTGEVVLWMVCAGADGLPLLGVVCGLSPEACPTLILGLGR